MASMCSPMCQGNVVKEHTFIFHLIQLKVVGILVCFCFQCWGSKQGLAHAMSLSYTIQSG
jgi:hypothetical protein